MATSRSSISSSRAWLRDLAIALLVLAALEVYLAATMNVFERRDDVVVTAPRALPANFYALQQQDPAALLQRLHERGISDPLVFVGDSQGATAPAGEAPYPEQVAAALLAAGSTTAVVSLHLGGANAYEQTTLLLALLHDGIVPRAVVWSHSIFSQRKNEVRGELAAAARMVGDDLARIAPNVALPAAATPTTEQPTRLAALSTSARTLADRSATVRFMQRSLWDKIQILRRSPLGRLIPARMVAGTARQFDPPSSILDDAARVVETMSGELVARDVVVLNVISPINRQAQPRPFTARAEERSYPALADASHRSGALFLNLLDALPPDHFGRYEDGTPDAFHIDGTGHAAIADTVRLALAELTRAAVGARLQQAH